MNYTPIQLKLPVDMERIIEINDSVYAFNEVLSHIDLKKYFVEKDCTATGRPRYGAKTFESVAVCVYGARLSVFTRD